jgi:hydrogenase expression/formation protein HypC
MCIALPLKIVKIRNNKAQTDKGYKEISLELTPEVKIGDYIIVQGDMAINKLDKKEAQKRLELFKEQY